MFHFAHPTGSYPNHHRQGRNTGYASRASSDTDYLVAQEEAFIRGRLADIEAQRHQPSYPSSFPYGVQAAQPPSFSYQENRLESLRREVELEEQRYAIAARRQEEEALEARLHAARQKRRALESVATSQREPAAALGLIFDEPQSAPSRQSRTRCHPHVVPSSFGRKYSLGFGRSQPQETVHPVEENLLEILASLGAGNPGHTSQALPFRNVLAQLAQPAAPSTPQRQSPGHSAPAGQSFMDFLSALQNSNPQSDSESVPIQNLMQQLFQGISSETQPSAAPSQQQSQPAPSTASSSAPAAAAAPPSQPPFAELLSTLLGGHPSNSGAQRQASAEFPDVLAQLGLLPTGGASAAQGSSCTPKPASGVDFLAQLAQLGSQFAGHGQQQAQPEQAGSSKSAAVSLKEELESRLYRDESVENKDIMEAIKASLQDSSTPAAPGHAQEPATGATPTSSTGSDDGKGKNKAEPVVVSSTAAATALDTIRNIDAAYRTLEAEFTFPSTLDFVATPSVSRSNSPHSSDSEPSSVYRLAFTSRNQPVRFFEESLNGLVAQLDEIETLGNEELRTKRKELVVKIEKSIEELDAEIDGRWKSKSRKDAKEVLKAREDKEQEEREIAAALEESKREAEEHVSEASLAESEQTVRPYDVEPEFDGAAASAPVVATEDAPVTPKSEALDTFLLPAETNDNGKVVEKKVEKKDSDSDWSEVDA